MLWASVPYALLVTTVLFGKHIDKAPWDEPEGMKTLPVILGEGAARKTTALLMIAFYPTVIALVVAGVISGFALLAVGALPVLRRAVGAFARPRPAEPPDRYPLWPMWFGPWAFLHARRAGALLVLGFVLGIAFSST